MLTGVCPICKDRKVLVRKDRFVTDNETNERVPAGWTHVVRTHGCGSDLVPAAVLSLEDAYMTKGGRIRMNKTAQLSKVPF